LLDKLVAVNRPTLNAAGTSSDLVHEERELLWLYVPCAELFPRIVSKTRTPNLYRAEPEITFSRVAFDQKATNALVYSWIHGLYGEEQFVTMLAKDKSGTWKIVKTQNWVGR
jgi:hypothetical protein